MATKRYIKADGRTWTEDYNEAGLWDTANLAGQVIIRLAEETCIIPDASGKWLVVNYADPDLAEPEERVDYVVLIGEANRIGGLYANFALAAKALEKHISEQGYRWHKTAGDTWVASGPNGAIVYQAVPYHVNTN